jgi:hypothetical protein
MPPLLPRDKAADQAGTARHASKEKEVPPARLLLHASGA